VLAYDVTALEEDDARIERLVAALETRLRSSDNIGWLNDGWIGVLLPLTSLTVARDLEVEIRDLLASREIVHGEVSPEARVYYFPPYQDRCKDSQWDPTPAGEPTREVLNPDAAERTGTPLSGDSNGHAAVRTATVVRAVQLLPLEPLSLHPSPIWKRAMDVAGAALGLLLFSPLLFLVALVLKCTSPGPVFFRQRRFGYLGRCFTIFKFRTMHATVDTNPHQQYVSQLAGGNETLTKLSNEEDFVFLGRFLRKTAIDELPQLINVLRGEMSLVGPRPDVIPVGDYPLWQRARFNVLPGLTGLWQVSGKNRTTFQEMIQLDIEYVQKLGITFDLKILARTVPAILQQLGDQSA
jgi:lipopolysaccharide/colanic/teichoic acid biosynthesis glycosyltransferase